ncbi:NAD(P)/FAD-dependent oxidoreductase [Pseudonocardia ailaonensis]|uniref:NAD(P)/FAD-dependent oxidoreductase n=1 Tax=Pseudonocardia ailaonensis TaxID=367279 RepID=A0ABN2N0H5_9PSEU
MSDTVDVLVIGAGFAGLHMVYKLREAGFAVHGLEAGSGPGGTWYWNRYPGARCDSEVMYYSFSFLPELEQEWPLQERYPAQPEILRYLERVTELLDLHKDFTFDTRVDRLTFDADTNLWTIRGEAGGEWTARFVVTAVGCLSAANVPQIPGADSFAGRTLHTAAWPHEPVDLGGKRVGVIGTGASGIQAIPVIATQAAHLTVFQRTAQFTLPAANGPLDPRMVELWKQNYPEWRRRARLSSAGIPYTPTDVSAMEVTAEERRARYEAAWEQGGYQFGLGTFNDILLNEESNATAADFVRGKIGELVDDPEVAELLTPRGYPIATKRMPLDTGYYVTYNRPNVSLVDLRRSPIEEITEAGIRTTAGLHELDVIVYATGFDALTGPLTALNVIGRNGSALTDAWCEGPRTYLGVAIPDFPNLFTITGPGSPSVVSNMPVSTEQHAEWIGNLLIHLREQGIERVEATREAADQWTDHVQQVASGTLYPRAASWYMGANIPGKPRVFLPYVGGVGNYRKKCDDVAASGYPGFALTAGRTRV